MFIIVNGDSIQTVHKNRYFFFQLDAERVHNTNIVFSLK